MGTPRGAVTGRRVRPLTGFMGIGLVLAACALPATQEGFNEAWCAADIEFEAAINEILTVEGSEAWVARTREAVIELQDDARSLPDWVEARDETVALVSSIDDVLDLLETGATGVDVNEEEWFDTMYGMLSARDGVRQVAGGCLVS